MTKHPVRSLFTLFIKMYKNEVSLYEIFEDILFLRRGELTENDYMDLSDILYMLSSLKHPYEKIGEIEELNNFPSPDPYTFVMDTLRSTSSKVETAEIVKLFKKRLDDKNLALVQKEIENCIEKLSMKNENKENIYDSGVNVDVLIIPMNKKNMPKA